MDDTIRLVIVDDHSLIRETWKLVLQHDPRIKVVAECASGEEAIRFAGLVSPDVMLMDINMTPVNGLEATQAITASQPHIRIIGLSINNQPAYARNMLQLGARGYMTKNSPREEMVKAILTVMEGGVYICDEIKQKMLPEGK